MPDPKLQAIVEKMVAAGEPEENIALVIQHYKPPAEPAPAQKPSAPQGLIDRVLADNPALPPMLRATQSVLRIVKNNPIQAGAIAGGIAAAPVSGGASLLPAAAAAGLGAAGGAGLGAIANAALGNEQGPQTAGGVLGTMAKEGALGATGEGVGRAVGSAAQLAGRGLYRAGLLPINQVLGKYGDVVKTGVENAVPVSKGGLEQATAIKGARILSKKATLSEADQRAMFSANQIGQDALSKLDTQAADLRRAGEGDPSQLFESRIKAFVNANPNGTLTPSRLEGVKSTLDDRVGGAYAKLRKREPLTPREQARLELTQAASRAQESVVPGYRQMNRGIMDASGLERAIQRRTQGSGGNQGLENALTMLGGISALPTRLLMLPQVLSTAGIGAYKAGQAATVPLAQTLKAALIAALGGTNDQQDQ